MTPKCVWIICFSVYFSLNFVTTAVTRNSDTKDVGQPVVLDLFPLDIVHYNDFHDRFEESSVDHPVCQTNDTNCLGGFARLYHEIKTLKMEKPDSLLLNAGDTFQGTYWFTLWKWNVTQNFINLLPHDAHTLGNHEFDRGISGLMKYLRNLTAPVVVANVDMSDEPSLKLLGRIKPYVVVERRGRKIGIIGVTTRETRISSQPGKVKFTDPVEAVKKYAQLLEKEGVKIIIVLSHCGFPEEKKIAREAGKYVDIIVGGHSHSLLFHELSTPTKERRVDDYPVIVKSAENEQHLVAVVTASSFTKYLGKLTAYFNDEGELVTWNGNPILLDRTIPEDPEVKALLKPYTEALHKLVNEVVGRTEGDLMQDPCSAGECMLGNIAADSILNATKERFPSELPSVVLFLRNMMKGVITKGDITRGAIVNMLPFGNELITYTIKGKYIEEALNICLSRAYNTSTFTAPWMPMVAGMEVTVNTTLPKVSSVRVKHGDTFKPLDEEQDYQLTTPDFLVTTGNLFPMLKENSRDKTVIGVDYTVFEEYIKKITPVKIQLDDRLVVVT